MLRADLLLKGAVGLLQMKVCAHHQWQRRSAQKFPEAWHPKNILFDNLLLSNEWPHASAIP